MQLRAEPEHGALRSCSFAAEAALSCLQEARLAGAWLGGVDAADSGVLPAAARAGAFLRAEQLKPLLGCGVSTSPCSEIPAEQEKPC